MLNSVRLLTLIILSSHSISAFALESLSYSGRLVNANGSPVTGSPNVKFDLVYSNNTTAIICSKTMAVPLSNGVFHVNLNYTYAQCGSRTLMEVLEGIPAGQSLAYQVTDLTNTRAYGFQPVFSVPSSIMSLMSKTLVQMGATDGQVLKWDGTNNKWFAANDANGGGSITNIATGPGLTGGPITSTGTISIANGGVNTTQLADDAVTSVKILDGSIAAADLGNDSVTTGKILDGSIIAGDLATGAVTSAKILDSTVATTDLADNSATFQKIQNISGSGTLLGRSSALPGLIEEITLGTGLTMNLGILNISDTADDDTLMSLGCNADKIPFHNGTAWTCRSAVSANTASTVVARDGSGGFAAGAVSAGSINYRGGSFTTTVQAPAGLAANYVLTLPLNDGNAGQVLTTDGAGVLTWGAASAGAITALTGDVAASGSGSVTATIQADAVTSTKILDGTIANADLGTDAVTSNKVLDGTLVGADLADTTVSLQKIQNIATNRILGRSTALPGTVEELTLGSGLSLAAGILNVSDTTDNDALISLGCVATEMPFHNGTTWTCKSATNANTAFAVVARDGSGNFSAGAISAGSILYRGGSFTTTVQAPAGLAANYVLTLPADDGTAGQVLTTDGAGVLTWGAASAGSITALTGDVAASGTGSVTATIQPDAVTSSKILDGTIANGDLGTDAVTSSKILDATIANADMGANSIATGNIVDGTIATGDVANNAITFAKFQNIATNRILGRSSVSAGNVEELTLGAGLNLTAGVLNTTDTADDDALMTLGCVATEMPFHNGTSWTCKSATNANTAFTVVARDGSGNFAAGAVSIGSTLYRGGAFTTTIQAAAGLAANYVLTLPVDDGTAGQVLTTDGAGVLTWGAASAGAITALTGDVAASGSGSVTATIQTGAVTSAKILDGTIATADLGSDAVTSGIILDGTIANTDLGSDSVTSAKVLDATLVGADLADSTVTFQKIQNVATNRILGRSSLSSGAIEELTLGTGLSLSAGVLNVSDTTDNDALISLGCNNTEMPFHNGTTWTCKSAVSANTASAVVVRDGSGNFAAGAVNAGSILYRGGSFTATVQAPAGLAANYVLTLPADDGTAGQVLTTDGAGVLTWGAASSGSITALTGDVAASGTGSVAATIQTGAVTSAKILDATIATGDLANNAVTYAKFQNVNSQILLGRSSASAGVVEELTLGSGLTLNLGVLNVTDTTDNDALISLGCSTNQIPLHNGTSWTCKSAVSANTASAVVARDASGNFAAGDVSAASVLYRGGSFTATVQAPAGLAANYVLTLPVDDGTAGQILTTDGAGVLSWASAGTSGITALTGDVAASGTGSVAATIQTGAVTSAKILDATIATGDLANNAVTYAKFQNVSSQILLGRSSGAAGVVEELTLGSGLTLNLGVLNVTDTTDNDALVGLGCAANEIPLHNGTTWTCKSAISSNIASAVVSRDASGNFAAGAVNVGSLLYRGGSFTATVQAPAGLAANYVLTLPLDDGTAGQILTTDGAGVLSWAAAGTSGITALTGDVAASGTGSVAATIQTGAVTSAKILDGTIANADMAANSVATGNIVDGTIATADVANSSITMAKIQDIATNKLLGRSTAASGVVEELAIGTGLTLSAGTLALSDTTDNDALVGLGCSTNEIPFHNGTTWTCKSAVSANTASAVVARDGSGNFAAGGVSAASVLYRGGSFTATVQAPAGLAASYVLTLPVDDGTAGQVLRTDGAGVLSWVAATAGSVTSVGVGTGLTSPAGANITSTGTLNIDVGTANGKILQMDAVGYPAANGSQITNLNPANLSAAVPATKGGTGLTAYGTANYVLAMNDAGTALEYTNPTAASPLSLDLTGAGMALTLGTVPTSKGGTGLNTTGAYKVLTTDASGAYQQLNCGIGEVLMFNGASALTCVTPATSANAFIQNGNSFAAGAVLGTNDANSLTLETANSPRMTILANGNVGIGNSSPTYKLDVAGSTRANGTLTNPAFTANHFADQFGFYYTPYAGSSTVAFAYGLVLDNPSVSTGSVTNYSGVVVRPAGNPYGTTSTRGVELQLASGAGVHNIYASGTANNYFNGNVGIGTATPTFAALEVRKGISDRAAFFAGSATNAGVAIGGSATAGTIISYGSGGGDVPLNIQPNGVSGTLFGSSGAPLSKVDISGNLAVGSYAGANAAPANGMIVSGNVGIGTTSPASALDVVINSSTLPVATLTNNWDNNSSYPALKLSRNRSSTAQPIAGFGTGIETFLEGTTDGSSTSAGQMLFNWETAPTSGPNRNTYIAFSTRTADVVSEKFRITASGNVGIGTTLTNGKLDVKGSIVMSGASSGFSGFRVPAAAGSTVWELPAADGTSGQVLSTNGSGVLAWAAAGSGSAITALTGDVTATGPGSVASTIATGAVTSTKILDATIANADMAANSIATGNIVDGTIANADLANNAVTYAKFQNVSTQILLGRSSGGAGLVEELTLGSGLTLNLGVLNVTDTTDNDALMALSCTTNQFPQFNGSIWVCASVPGSNWTLASGNVYRSTGNVGIGTATPASKLHVYDAAAGNTLRVESGANGAVVQTRYTGLTAAAAARSWGAGMNITDGSAAYEIYDYTAGASRIAVGLTGNVGIGTTSPSGKLDVYDATATSAIYARGGTVSSYLFSSPSGSLAAAGTASNHPFAFYINGAERMRVETSGNVGIGTTVPSQKLDVVGSAKVSGSLLMSNDQTVFFGGSNTASITGADAATASYLRFATSGNEAMRLIASGNVGIGATAPAEKLEVVGNVKATSFISTSDRRLKKDIEVVKGLALIEKLTGVSWRWKADGKFDGGVIAQDVEKVIPWAVVTDENTGHKSVKYNALVGPMIESIKELKVNQDKQNREIASLKETNVAITNENQKLKSEVDQMKSRLQRIEKMLEQKK